MPRKQKKYHFIYKTICETTGKYYWGMHSTNNLNDGYIGSGKRLRYSINKHGKENHKREIIEFFKTREELGKREIEIVNLNEIIKKDCMNLRVGGLGGEREYPIKPPWNKGHKGITKLNLNEKQRKKRRKDQNKIWIGRKHSEETKLKMNKSHIGQVPINKGIPISEETRKKCSESMSGEKHPNFGKNWSGMLGKTHSEETKKQMSESHSGENNHFYGKTHSEETRKRISDLKKGNKNMLGKTHNSETRKKISEAKKGKPSGRLGINHSEESKKKISDELKKYWADKKK